jgi:hypothetical protein
MRKIVFIVVALLSFSKVFAACPDCWKLKYVNVQMNDGSNYYGYLLWNDEWKKKVDSVKQKSFHQIVASYYAKQAMPIVIYRHIVRFEQYFGDKIIATNETDTVNPAMMTKIEFSRPGEFDGISGYGTMPVIDIQDVDALTAGPIAIYKVSDSKISGDMYLISFTNDYDMARLETLYNGTDKKSLSSLKPSDRVVVLRFPKEK